MTDLERANKRIAELTELAKIMRDWIDAVPSNTQLPAMPGFDRDWADAVISNTTETDDLDAAKEMEFQAGLRSVERGYRN